MNDYISVSTSELGKRVKKGDNVTNGTITGILQYAIDATTGNETSTLGYVKEQDGTCYIASINNKLLRGWKKCSSFPSCLKC